jgi:hypothetical protein
MPFSYLRETIKRAAAESAWNASMSLRRLRRTDSISLVRQLPKRTQITLGGPSVHEQNLSKVVILGDNREIVGSCILPDFGIAGVREPANPDMQRFGTNIGQQCYKARRNVLIEEEPQGRLTSGRGITQQATLAVGGKRQHGKYVLALQLWKVGENVGFRHAAGQIVKNVIHRDASSADTWLSAPLASLHGNSAAIVH